MTFGQSLRDARRQKGLSQKALAEKMGYVGKYGDIDCSQISNYETGKCFPTWYTVIKLVEILGKEFIFDALADYPAEAHTVDADQ